MKTLISAKRDKDQSAFKSGTNGLKTVDGREEYWQVRYLRYVVP